MPGERDQQGRTRGRPARPSHLVVADTPERSLLPQPTLFEPGDFISLQQRKHAGNYADIVIRLPQADVREEQHGSMAPNQAEL